MTPVEYVGVSIVLSFEAYHSIFLRLSISQYIPDAPCMEDFFYCRHNSPNVGKYSLHLAYMGISKSTMTHQSVRKGACHLGVNAENESSFQVGASQGAHW